MPLISLFSILLPLPYNTTDFNFHGTSYDWLVIAGANVQDKKAGLRSMELEIKVSSWRQRNGDVPQRSLIQLQIPLFMTALPVLLILTPGINRINKKTIVE